MKTLVKLEEVAKKLPQFRRCHIGEASSVLGVNRIVLEVPKTKASSLNRINKCLQTVNPDICIGTLKGKEVSTTQLPTEVVTNYLRYNYLKKSCIFSGVTVILAGVSMESAWFWSDYLLKENVNLLVWDKNYNKSEIFAYHIYHNSGKSILPIHHREFCDTPVIAITKEAESLWQGSNVLNMSSFIPSWLLSGDEFSIIELAAILHLKEIEISEDISLKEGNNFCKILDNYGISTYHREKLDFFK